MRSVVSIPPPFSFNDSYVDLDFSGKGKLETVAALEGEGNDGVGGCTFNSLIEVTPHCLFLFFNRPLVSDERLARMYHLLPLIHQ